MILVADDNEFSRRVLRKLLVQLGEQVTEAPCGDATVGVIMTQPIEIVIADYVMRRGGTELLDRIREARPACKVILATGMDPSNFEGLNYDAYLWKPYDVDDLKAAIARVRSARRS